MPCYKVPLTRMYSQHTSRGVSYKCNRCSGCVHVKCSRLLNAAPLPPLSSASPTKQISDDSTFNVLQFHANGIVNKLTELGVVLDRNKFKVAVIQESKLTTQIHERLHPELHNNAQGPFPWSRRSLADLHSQVDNLGPNSHCH